MKFAYGFGVSLAVTALMFAQVDSSKAQNNGNGDKEKTLYSFGYTVGKDWRSFGFSDEEMKIITEAMTDSALRREPKVDPQKWLGKAQQLIAERQRKAQATIIEQQTADSAALLAKEAQAPGATKTASGLIITKLKPGTGASPAATSKVTVHYHGTLGDGTVFDSSIRRGQPATFPLNGVIKCWTEGLQLMKVGGKSRLVCPADLAYGNQGAGSDIPPAAAIIFEVELLSVE
ncbi:MAG: FKBP-type peptidyl-prolyl cis-trans isomerase [Hyphomicrobiaceae bacterium]